MLAGGEGLPSEFEIKAIYLVKFIQFVDWPSAAFAGENSPLVIGVLGSDPFGEVLDEVTRDEMIKNRRVTVRRFHNLRDVEGVQVLYVSSSERSRMHSILAAMSGRSVLTVGDVEGFSVEGGVVRFVTENRKVHFRINIDAAKRANLQISSKLLQLAEIVRDGQK